MPEPTMTKESRRRVKGPAADRIALLTSIIDSSSDAIVAKTPDGLIISWNGGAERMFGYAADEILDRPVSSLIRADRRTEMDQVLQRIRDGARVEAFETIWVRKDGAEIPLSFLASPMHDDAGAVIGVASIARDLSARAPTKDKYRGIVESAPDAMVVVDQTGKIQVVNAQTEKLFGYPRAELMGQLV